MTQERNYDVGDYVHYEGRFGDSIARIVDTQISFEMEEPILFLYNSSQKIIGDYNDIRPIKTSENHLRTIGFSVNQSERETYYTLGNIVVAEISITYPDPQSQLGKSFIFCGFRAKLGQISNEEIVKAVGEKYDEITFAKVFAPAVFLMQLFDFLDKNEIKYDKEPVALIK